MSSKRQSVLPRVPAGPKAPANFSSSIIIADSALLTGHHTINVSAESVINPRAKLDSSNGRVTIGRRCIIHERTHIGAAPTNPSPADSRDGVMIHDYATVEVGATVEAGGTVIGEGTLRHTAGGGSTGLYGGLFEWDEAARQAWCGGFEE
ncbi:hypothetical protein DL766_003767 [Monosporascus sp. MC13-8B]|uniref:Dynactin subunit 6 n=1 Tax=Monosporascus cannonballus TaxID=155416 RepID=A0ABY0H629_9PEZI|nr:hypothetical protein DL762_005044 [Monosporascus cannonballus]RYP01283.1 hypothetical protein DL763_000255 [Monosporascus cannonballus]RYP32878.1 hypothetical protein DL766_003767 [Monosporascus sp. MC13-8B]